MIRRTVAAFAFVLLGAGNAAAQSGWDRLFPRVHYFDPLIADLQEPRLGLGFMSTDLFERAPAGRERPPFALPDPEDAATDYEIMASIGGSLPLVWLKQWPGKGGIVASAQLGVTARFRIEYPTREHAGEDWYVGMPFEVRYEKFTGRFRIMHRSSHIGDELVQVSGAERIEFGGEFADFLAGWRFDDALRVYGGATYNFRSYTEILPALRARGLHDYGQLQAGFDGSAWRWSDGHVGVQYGADWQAQQRTNWRSTFTGAAGMGVRTDKGSMRLLARYYHGPSQMGEFFMTPESFWLVEWVVDF